MTALAGSALDWLAGAGGTLALCFIVLLALGIGALTLLFFGSAVIVLERFARAARRPASAVTVAVLFAIGAGAIAVALQDPASVAEGSTASERWLRASAGVAAAAGLLLPLVALLQRRVSARALGAAMVAWLVMGLGCLAGASASPAAGQLGAGLLLALGAVLALGLLPLAIAGIVDLHGGAEWFLARRYLVAQRRQTFISIITLICVGGVAVGVWLIVTVLSVMNGFERTWREEIIGNRAHFTVLSGVGPIPGYRELVDRVREASGVVGATPYVDAEGMVRGNAGEIVAVRLRGIDPQTVGGVTDLREEVVAGSLEDLAPHDPSGDDVSSAPGIVIGHELASAFGLEIGGPLLLVSPFGGPPTPLGPAPRLKRFRVAAIFRSSFMQFDEAFTYTSLEAAQDFKRVDDVVDGVEVRVTDYYRSRKISRVLQEELGFPYFTRDWKEYFPSFFQALKTERVMMFVLLTMIMVVAAFVIVATLIMMIMEKSSDIAILKTMGASDDAIERIFALEGTLIGLVGTATGVGMGIVTVTQLDWIQAQIEAVTGIDTLPATVYQFSTLPFEIDPVQLVVVVTIALVLSLGATLIPSRQGARLDPAEALRYE